MGRLRIFKRGAGWVWQRSPAGSLPTMRRLYSDLRIAVDDGELARAVARH